MTPSEFVSEYVNPAIGLWRADTNSKVLAICAVSQLDILAEVTFNHLRDTTGAPAKSAAAYREKLAKVAPAIGMVSDAHDAHKHGSLRNGARHFASGLVQVRTAGAALFADHGFLDHDFLGETDTSLRLNDDLVVRVADLIQDVRTAWDTEFVACRLPPWP